MYYTRAVPKHSNRRIDFREQCIELSLKIARQYIFFNSSYYNIPLTDECLLFFLFAYLSHFTKSFLFRRRTVVFDWREQEKYYLHPTQSSNSFFRFAVESSFLTASGRHTIIIVVTRVFALEKRVGKYCASTREVFIRSTRYYKGSGERGRSPCENDAIFKNEKATRKLSLQQRARTPYY